MMLRSRKRLMSDIGGTGSRAGRRREAVIARSCATGDGSGGTHRSPNHAPWAQAPDRPIRVDQPANRGWVRTATALGVTTVVVEVVDGGRLLEVVVVGDGGHASASVSYETTTEPSPGSDVRSALTSSTSGAA